MNIVERSFGAAAKLRPIGILSATLGLCAAISAPVQASAITDVNEDLIASIRSGGTPPPVAARAIAMVQIAMYDAVNAATGNRYQSYSHVGGAVSGVSGSAAAYAAGYDMLAKLFPAKTAVLLAERDARIAALGLNPGVAAASQTLGGGIATSFFLARSGDGASVAQSPYSYGSGPGVFQSTVNPPADPALPGWGNVTPFVLASGDQFRLPAPPALGSPEFLAAYGEVKTLGCATCGTVEQQEIARFWADGGGTLTPPGHWVDIASGILTSQSLTLMQQARIMAVVGASVADAAISAWDSKYSYNYWRPVTAINACTAADCGVDGEVGWVPYLGTPNFPSYASGHSTFSGAASGALAAIFGDSYNFCVQPDVIVPLGQRCFTSFSAAADEAGKSRIYGGIHFEFDNGPALAAGRAIGLYAYSTAFGRTVPEPATWAMMIIGFGAIGLALRRRAAAAQF